jgi:hypothetical protein
LKDIRTQLPECPLEYEVPPIPGTHTALVIVINAADIDWKERMLPWTLASLINNTDLVMQGVHLYIACENGTEARIQTALKRFDLPENTIIKVIGNTHLHFRYDAVYVFNINHWAFRDGENQIKLPIEQLLKPNAHNGYAFHEKPQLCNMRHATKDMFRNAIQQLMGAQLAMKV